MAEHATAPEMVNGQTLRQVFLTNYARLKQERQEVLTHCREINQLFMPRSGRFFEDRPNTRPGRRNTGIYDSTATRAVRTTAASLQSTTSSPARPWFRLATGDRELDMRVPVKTWCDDVRQAILDTFQESNIYQSLHQLYLELVLYGTAVAVTTDDPISQLRMQTLTFGEYCLDADASGRVDTVYREFRMTTAQMVKRFGIERCSRAVQSEFQNNQRQNWHDVVHVIEPRDAYDATREDPANKPWRSVYLELNSGDDHQQYQGLLRDSGFDRFPVIAIRWEVQGSDVYGVSPAMDCLGDVQSLQQATFRLHQCVDYKTKPPMALPTAMRGAEVNMNPGGKTFVTGTQPAVPLWMAQLDEKAVLELIRDIRDRIHSNLFVDVFLSLLNSSDTTQRTAEEIRERRDEKFQLLGPVADRLSHEGHEPLIKFAFYTLLAAGTLPPIPRELSARPIRIEFISVLAQAQKAIQTVSTDRILGTVLAIAGAGRPDVWDKLDIYYLVDHLVDRYGGDPRLVVSTDEAVAIAEARNRAMAAKEQAAQAEQVSKAVKNVGDASAGLAPLTGAEAAGMFTGSGLGDAI